VNTGVWTDRRLTTVTQWADHVWLLWCIDAKEKVAVLSKEFPDELEVFAPCIWDGIEEIGEIGCGCLNASFRWFKLFHLALKHILSKILMYIPEQH